LQVFFDEGGHVLFQFGGLQDLDMIGKAQVEPADAFHLIDLDVTACSVFRRLLFNHFLSIEGEVFVVGDVAELVAEAAGGADGLVDVAVGVAVDPVVDAAGGHLQDSLVGVARCEVDVRDL